jgi:hypothetical protein
MTLRDYRCGWRCGSAGTPVTLQPCGETARTVWVLDAAESNCPPQFGLPSGYLPLINGSNANFSHPFVLSYPSNGPGMAGLPAAAANNTQGNAAGIASNSQTGNAASSTTENAQASVTGSAGTSAGTAQASVSSNAS